MSGFDDLFRTARMFEKLNSHVKLASGWTKLGVMTPQFDSLKSYTSIAESVRFNNPFKNNTDWVLSFHKSIPETTFHTINAISKQHFEISKQWGSLMETFHNTSSFHQISSLNIALNHVASQVTSLSLANKSWDLLEEFEAMSEEAVTLNERISDSNDPLTKKDLEEFKEFFSSRINQIESKINKLDEKDRTLLAKIVLWGTILSFIFMIKDQIIALIPKSEAVTQKDFQDFKKEMLDTVKTYFKEQKDYRIIDRKCRVFYKPNSKSLILTSLPKGVDIIVLQINHQWAYVSYHNPKDNLTETGWVLKKYLKLVK